MLWTNWISKVKLSSALVDTIVWVNELESRKECYRYRYAAYRTTDAYSCLYFLHIGFYFIFFVFKSKTWQVIGAKMRLGEL